MKALKVGYRLSMLVAMFVILLIVIGGLGLRSASKTLAGLETVYEDRTVPLVQITRVKRLLDSNFSESLRAFQHDPCQELAKLHDHAVDEHLKRIESNLKTVDETWKAYLATQMTPEEQQLADAFTARYQEYTKPLTLPTMDALRQGNYSLEVVSTFLKGNRKMGGEVDKLADALIDLQTRVAKEEFDRDVAQYESARNLSVVTMILGVLLGVEFSWWLIRSVTRPLAEIRDVVTYVQTSGDFTRSVTSGQHDEVGQTAQAFNALLASLRGTLGDLLQAIHQVNRASGDMSENAAQSALASSATSESASAMAASVEQMSVSVSEVGNGARRALELAQQAGSFSSRGGEVIQQAVAEIAQIADTVRRVAATITELGSRSERISGVVQVIKDVADQTTGATGEIAQMVEEIQVSARSAVGEMGQAVTQVDAGVSLAAQAGQSIADIQESTADVVRVVGDITDAIVEQGAASQSIASQVERVAQAAEQNSAAAAQSSDAAGQMRNLAVEMSGLAGRFRI
ncbi:methyl-accepting chemotaxis protein [Azospira sp. I13]|uniref:HAMP domain-containing methyl-accepting chemotaxis protein n=1 Tax=Azospira sp. I13 TaxID=1765050 RepID=UPI000D455F6F|nr:methyl-accepting chemotaxis protein [Azospira sp. I13]GBG02585.1 methyl-accepting chemotaxis protein [Azospira sp. I13]